jgi:hypothetical protein
MRYELTDNECSGIIAHKRRRLRHNTGVVCYQADAAE